MMDVEEIDLSQEGENTATYRNGRWIAFWNTSCFFDKIKV